MNNTLAVVSLVIGILAMLSNVCNCVPLVNWVAWIGIPVLALAAIVTGVIGFTQADAQGGEGKPLAIAGATMGCLSLLTMGALILFMVFGYAALVAANGGL